MAMTDEEILAQANRLCRELAAAEGYSYPPEHLFFLDPSPRDQHYWDLTAVAFDVLRATDLSDTLANLDIERPDPKATLPGMAPSRKRRR